MYANHAHREAHAPEKSPSLRIAPSSIPPLRRGKDKDVYDLGDMLLLVFTDRVSPFGKASDVRAAGKGWASAQLSAHWFRKLRGTSPNHFISNNPACFPERVSRLMKRFDGRALAVWKATPLPIRCVVRGYLAGPAWAEYRETGEICGNRLPSGWVESQRLPSPIFTPTVKGRPDGANEGIAFTALRELLGKSLAEQLRETSLRLYFDAWRSARERGILIAETKFEFGLHDGELLLIDECLTPDTSRFWQIDGYRYGGRMQSLDKHLLEDRLEEIGSTGQARLPEGVVSGLAEKYHDVYRRLVARRSGW